ncbi:hypothetical protein ACFQY7_25150 [Actinomadura luteofluorescens]|uniref:Uncharacterized protein n=1 Tax=Actinomadura luteofluorescens TaxID=46163 RepID=A0A7Y9EMN8_9ACTN|nr:hypothetical protein [Actinomadura luteofluorescens]NYD50608.1 hypothetical protein [Actinomadura luteofluorescens]
MSAQTHTTTPVGLYGLEIFGALFCGRSLRLHVCVKRRRVSCRPCGRGGVRDRFRLRG